MLYLSKAAYFVNDSGKLFIIYNSKVPYNETLKLSIARELGSIILGHYESDSISEKEKESEAEYFSMLILMHPLLLFRNSLTSYREVQLYCHTSAALAKAAFDNYLDFCRFHNFTQSDSLLLKHIDVNINNEVEEDEEM